MGESSQPVHSPLPDNTSSPRTAGSHHTLARWSSFSVFTPNREILVLFKLELCINFFTPLICVMSCCFFFFSLSFWVGEGISTSFCLSGTKKGEMSQHHLHCEHPSHPSKSTLSFADKWLCTPVPTTMFLLGAFSHLGTELKQNQSRTPHNLCSPSARLSCPPEPCWNMQHHRSHCQVASPGDTAHVQQLILHA